MDARLAQELIVASNDGPPLVVDEDILTEPVIIVRDPAFAAGPSLCAETIVAATPSVRVGGAAPNAVVVLSNPKQNSHAWVPSGQIQSLLHSLVTYGPCPCRLTRNASIRER